MMNTTLAGLVVVATFAAGTSAGVLVDRNIMNGRIDRIQAQHAELARQAEVQRAGDERAARATEQKIVDAAGKAAQENQNEIDRIRTSLADATGRLQQRADRRPASPGAVSAVAPACAGTTGAELSRPDGQFLIGEAARGDQLRAALEQCYAQYDGARALINASHTAP